MADGCFHIPMEGFVESYNVSVAAALTLWEARRVRAAAAAAAGGGRGGGLTAEEQQVLKALLFLRAKGLAAQHVASLLARRPPQWQVRRGWWCF
jgi:tRNA (guanosine-2'-O-)-methyltransferase